MTSCNVIGFIIIIISCSVPFLAITIETIDEIKRSKQERLDYELRRLDKFLKDEGVL